MISRIRSESFGVNTEHLTYVHILDLHKDGVIKPHIDSIRVRNLLEFSENWFINSFNNSEYDGNKIFCPFLLRSTKTRSRNLLSQISHSCDSLPGVFFSGFGG